MLDSSEALRLSNQFLQAKYVINIFKELIRIHLVKLKVTSFLKQKKMKETIGEKKKEEKMTYIGNNTWQKVCKLYYNTVNQIS